MRANTIHSPALGCDVTVSYLPSVNGPAIVGALADCWNVRFESCAPVRVPGSFKGQQNFTGLWWCATTRSHVVYESWAERDQLMLLDFASDVVGVSAQPFRLRLETGCGPREHTPDFFARRRDGSALVIDVRPDGLVKEKDREVFEATARACREVGWGYQRVGAPAPVYAANVRWLAGYRHPRCFSEASAAVMLSLAGTADQPLTVMELARAAGEPVVTLPALFHLMWLGRLRADLHCAPLRATTALIRGADHA